MEKYAELTNDVEFKLDEADKQAESTDVRHSHDEIYSSVRARTNAKRRDINRIIE